MIIVCGLGNPGRKYERTRHNIGWMVLDRIALESQAVFSLVADMYMRASVRIADEKVMLLKPATFMNRSGVAVKRVMARNGVNPEGLIVIHDDLDLEPGRIKLKLAGGTGGHNGLKSICADIGSREFFRIRIGIGRATDPAQHVLSPFKKHEMQLVDDAVFNAARAVEMMITDYDKAMNEFNSRR